jgi:hypothetical protein
MLLLFAVVGRQVGDLLADEELNFQEVAMCALGTCTIMVQ